ncbi:MAG: SpaA isopeptide-forming pilin-related protein, partial [Coriobacteriia bacterium]|nr:SpaA isopeptide-forming pilin-related protein [Coriobacteriia bacterium]
MATFIWKRVKGGSPSARVFSAYLALVLTIAMVGPGLSVYAADGGAQKGRASEPVVEAEPVVEEPVLAAEPVEPVVEEPVLAAEPVEPVVEEPIAEEPASAPAAVASAEEPVEPSREIATTVAPLVVAVAPLNAGARPICEGGVKLDENPRTGTYTISTPDVEVTPTTPTDFEITISTYDNGAGMLFDFTSNYPVTHIGVKGGNTGYNDYYFNPAATSGIGLHAPMNPSRKWADISHIIFCFGEEPVNDSHIIVMKFRDDVVTNGEHDGGENWLAGFAFRLESGDSEDGPWSFVADVTTEGTNGQADFGMRPVGWYRLTEMLTQDQIDAGETPTSGDPLGQMVFYHTAQVNSEKRFGNIITDEPEGDLIVYKYHDLNENGEYDDGEPMLEDWEFTLTQSTPPITASAISLVATGTTDVDGELLFGGLEPGEYTVTETLQDGWTNTTPLSQDVTVVDGQTASLWFGNIPVIEEPEEGDLIVYKYHDLTENGE